MQHDGQEFLAYMIDVLHEDLNRVLRKKYVEMKEYATNQDEDQYFKKLTAAICERNDSIMMEIFFGMFRAVTRCTECGFEVINFEPFSMLTVPVVRTHLKKTFSFYYMAEFLIYELVNFEMSVQQADSFADVKQSFAEKKKLDARKLHFYHFSKEKRSFSLLADEQQSAYNFEKKAESFLFLIQDLSPIFLDQLPDLDQQPQETQRGLVRVYLEPDCSEPSSVAGVRKLVLVPQQVSLRSLYVFVHGVFKKMFSHYVESFDREFAADRSKELFVLSKAEDELPLGQADALIAVTEGERIKIKVSKELQNQSKWRSLSIEPDSFRSAQTSIYECLEAFTQQEDLDEENKWFCTRCKQHQLAKRQLKLKQLPSILLIHFKRFKKTSTGFNKLDEVIEFPFEGLQVSEYTSDPASPQNQARYSLFAIIAHRGTMFKGHYVAFIHCSSNKAWIKFDDELYSSVKPDIRSELNSYQPYILFYRRESTQ